VAASLVIELDSEASAECVAHAMEAFGGALRRRRGRWIVKVPEHDSEFVPLLQALEGCLSDNEIALVKISVGNRRYVMAGGR
jgi:hypothetical protein